MTKCGYFAAVFSHFFTTVGIMNNSTVETTGQLCFFFLDCRLKEECLASCSLYQISGRPVFLIILLVMALRGFSGADAELRNCSARCVFASINDVVVGSLEAQ